MTVLGYGHLSHREVALVVAAPAPAGAIVPADLAIADARSARQVKVADNAAAFCKLSQVALASKAVIADPTAKAVADARAQVVYH